MNERISRRLSDLSTFAVDKYVQSLYTVGVTKLPVKAFANLHSFYTCCGERELSDLKNLCSNVIHVRHGSYSALKLVLC